MRNLYAELKKQLKLGFHLDNLQKVAALCDDAAWNSSNPVGLFVIAHVFWWLNRQWRDGESGIPTLVAERMQQVMEPPILSYLEACEKGLNPETEMEHLNAVVRAVLKWAQESEDLKSSL